MEIILPLSMGIAMVTIVWTWKNTNGRLFTKVRAVFSVCIIGVVGCLAMLAVYAVIILGATSIEDILAKLL